MTNLVCQDSQCHVHNKRLESLSGKAALFVLWKALRSTRCPCAKSYFSLAPACTLQGTFDKTDVSLFENQLDKQHSVLPASAQESTLHNQHVGNRDSSDHVSGVCGKLRINLPSKSDQWKTLDHFFKATLVPFVLETSDVNNKFSALVDGIHQACSACFRTEHQYNYSQSQQCRNRSCQYSNDQSSPTEKSVKKHTELP